MKLKNYFCSLFLILLTQVVFAQDPAPGPVTVYSEGGEKFTLYLNGGQINAFPESRVVAQNVSEVPIAFRIVFENSAIPELRKNGMRQGKSCLYAIEKNKKMEYVFRMRGCSEEAAESSEPSSSAPTSSPAQLSATYSDGVISINDGRTLSVKKIKVNGMTYPKVIMTALQGAKVTVEYDSEPEKYSAEAPMQYEVKNFQNNNSYFKFTVDEGGPAKTWYVKMQNSNGYDLKIEK